MKKDTFCDPTRLSRYNRRQRKKLHIGEFQELVFKASVTFDPPLDNKAFDRFLDDVIEFVESRNLGLWGLGGCAPLSETSGLIQVAYQSPLLSPTEEDRQALLAWLQAYPQASSAQVGDFVDAWYGFDDEGDVKAEELLREE